MGDPQYLPMNKTIWKLSIILTLIGLVINLIPFKIFAEVSTYIDRDIEVVPIWNYNETQTSASNFYGTDVTEWFSTSSTAGNTYYPSVGLIFTNVDATAYLSLNDRDKRFTSFIDTYNNSKRLVFGWVIVRGNNSYVNANTVIRYGRTGSQYYTTSKEYTTIDGTTYDFYYGWINYNDLTDIETSWNIAGYTKTTDISYRQLLYDLTYGDLHVDPQPITQYGELIISYRQNIMTQHPEQNLDMISWNGYRDTLGNDLNGLNIEIQAIAGYFEGSTYADLKQSSFSDWLASTHPAVTMYKGTIEKSHEEYKWGDVASNFRNINTLGTWFWNIFTSENTWYQYGWRYQARLLDEELEPLTEWQMIYTGNSYSPSATETLTDDEPLTPDDVDIINDINDENGTTNNWYINNTYITNNEYNQTYQQNIIENIYNILQGTPDDGLHNKAEDVQQTIDNAIDTEDNYLNDLQTQLNDLELNDITQNNGLMKALRWVREVHHETIETTVIGPIVLTIMLIGLITYLIGRRNG